MQRPPAYAMPRTLSETDFRWILRRHPEWLGSNITVVPDLPGGNIKLQSEPTLHTLPACHFPSGLAISDCPQLRTVQPGIRVGASSLGAGFACDHLAVESLDLISGGTVVIASSTLRTFKLDAQCERPGSHTLSLTGRDQVIELTGRINGVVALQHCSLTHLGKGLTLIPSRADYSLVLNSCQVKLLDISTPTQKIGLKETAIAFRMPLIEFRNMEALDGIQVYREAPLSAPPADASYLETDLDLA